MEETLTTTTINDLTASEAALAGGLVGSMLATCAIFVIVFYLLYIIASWKIFKKAGEPGWKSIIPIYNVYIMFKIVNMKSWFWYIIAVSVITTIMMSVNGYNPYAMTEQQLAGYSYAAHPITIIALVILCVVELVAAIIYVYRLSKVFGHGVGYSIGLFFLPWIFWLILGFGKSKYDKKLLKK